MVEYYSAIKKNEIIPFTTTWIDLEIIILSEESQIKTDIIQLCLYVAAIKNDKMNFPKSSSKMNLYAKWK